VHLRACRRIEGAATDQHEGRDTVGMRGREGEREHRAPRVADERRGLTVRRQQLVEVGEVALYPERLGPARAALERLDHAEVRRERMPDRRHRSGRAGPAVHEGDERSLAAVGADAQHSANATGSR
jgi:hypothetical protein